MTRTNSAEGTKKVGNVISDHPKTTIAIAALALSAALLAEGQTHSRAPAPKHEQPSYTYLAADQQEKVEIADGMTPEGLVKAIYQENRRDNQGPADVDGTVLMDAERYVAEQGSIAEKNSAGVTVHYLKTGQTVNVPVITPDQAAASLQAMEGGK